MVKDTKGEPSYIVFVEGAILGVFDDIDTAVREGYKKTPRGGVFGIQEFAEGAPIISIQKFQKEV